MPLLPPAKGPNLDSGKDPTEFQSFEFKALKKAMEISEKAKLSGDAAETSQADWLSDRAKDRHWPTGKTGRPQYSKSIVKNMKAQMGIRGYQRDDRGKGNEPSRTDSSSGRPSSSAGPYDSGTSSQLSGHRQPPASHTAPNLRGQASKRSLKEISRHGGSRGESSSSSSPSPGGQPEKRVRESIPSQIRQWSASEKELLLKLCCDSDKGWFIGFRPFTCKELAERMNKALKCSVTRKDIMAEIERDHASDRYYRRKDLDFLYSERGMEISEAKLCMPGYRATEYYPKEPYGGFEKYELEALRHARATRESNIAQRMTDLAKSRQWFPRAMFSKTYTDTMVQEMIQHLNAETTSSHARPTGTSQSHPSSSSDNERAGPSPRQGGDRDRHRRNSSKHQVSGSRPSTPHSTIIPSRPRTPHTPSGSNLRHDSTAASRPSSSASTNSSRHSESMLTDRERDHLLDLCIRSDISWYTGDLCQTYGSLTDAFNEKRGWKPGDPFGKSVDDVAQEINRDITFYRRRDVTKRVTETSLLGEPDLRNYRPRKEGELAKCQYEKYELDALYVLWDLDKRQPKDSRLKLACESLHGISKSRQWPAKRQYSRDDISKMLADIKDLQKRNISFPSPIPKGNSLADLTRTSRRQSSKDSTASTRSSRYSDQRDVRSESPRMHAFQGPVTSSATKHHSPPHSGITRARLFSQDEREELLRLCQESDMKWYTMQVETRATYNELALTMNAWCIKNKKQKPYYYHTDVVQEILGDLQYYQRKEKPSSSAGSGEPLSLGTHTSLEGKQKHKESFRLYETVAMTYLIKKYNGHKAMADKAQFYNDVASDMNKVSKNRQWSYQRVYTYNTIETFLENHPHLWLPNHLPTISNAAIQLNYKSKFSLAQQKLLHQLCEQRDKAWFEGKSQKTYQSIADEMNLNIQSQLGSRISPEDIKEELWLGHRSGNIYGRLKEPGQNDISSSEIAGRGDSPFKVEGGDLKKWQSYERTALLDALRSCERTWTGKRKRERACAVLEYISKDRQWPTKRTYTETGIAQRIWKDHELSSFL